MRPSLSLPRMPGEIIGYRKNGTPIRLQAGAATTAADMIVPEVWRDMVQAEFTGNLVIGDLAYSDDSLVGSPGDTIAFPRWNALSDIDDIAETDSLTPEKLTTDEGDQATIKEAGKAVEFTDKSLLVSFGDPVGEARRQVGLLTARKVDSDLANEAENALNKYDGTGSTDGAYDGAMSWDVVVQGGIATFGDQWNPANMAALVVHSKQHLALLQDPNFIDASKLGQQSVILRGQVGSIGNVPVVMSDRVVTSGSGDSTIYHALMLKRNVLGVLWKRHPIVETDRDILARTNVITTNFHYGVKLTGDTQLNPGRGVLKTYGVDQG